MISTDSEKDVLTRNQINILSGIAGQISPAIDNAKKTTEEENRKRLQQGKLRQKGTGWL